MDDLMNILNDLDNNVIDVSGNLNEVKIKSKIYPVMLQK